MNLLPALVLLLGAPGPTLPNTEPLKTEGDLAAQMVAGISKYLDRETEASVKHPKRQWQIDYSSLEKYRATSQPYRAQLAKILGVVDNRVKPNLTYITRPGEKTFVAETKKYRIHEVRWDVLPGVEGYGLLLEPIGAAMANAIAIPDADWTPADFVGLTDKLQPSQQYPRFLAEHGARVLVPMLINRDDTYSGSEKLKVATNQPHREFIYRMAYEMGRHIIGYEVQKLLAAIDWFKEKEPKLPIVLAGHTEGALLALHTAAISGDVRGTVLGGYFGPGGRMWQQPIYRNVWSYHTTFGDAELIRLTAPGTVIIANEKPVTVAGPKPPRPGRGGAAPGRLEAADLNDSEFKRYMNDISPGIKFPDNIAGTYLTTALDGPRAVRFLWKIIFPDLKIDVDSEKNLAPTRKLDEDHLQKKQFDQLVQYTQQVWRDSESTRAERFAKVNFSNPADYEKSIEPIRKFFHEEVIGALPKASKPNAAKSRLIYDTPKWTGYEVTLDVHDDVFAYGILLLPKDLKPNEKRPVVVCQHGLEGRPTDICNPKEVTKYYNSFGAKLADLGYIVFAPQNPYIGQDNFRVLQRKANPLKLSLFSFIVRQHEVILDWLSGLPGVDPKKLAFYGLSYGGKTAMRVPAILPHYCLSICSGDFNEWIGKNVTVGYRGSYMWTGEYEMPEFDLGTTFNYAEMAYLIAPRPFMVERGHNDGVGIDEMVSYEYAKVRYLYANKLKLPGQTEIEYFPGGHEINSKGTFAFLNKHLGFPGK